MTEIVPKDAEALLTWRGLLDAFEAGHRLPLADLKDMFLYRGQDTILDRGAWIDGLGALVKVATIFPGNAAKQRPRRRARVRRGCRTRHRHRSAPKRRGPPGRFQRCKG